MQNKDKKKPTHIMQVLFDVDTSSIFSPEKLEGIKYVLGAKDTGELLNKYVTFIVSKITNAIADQKDILISGVFLNKFDDFIQQKQAQEAMLQGQMQESHSNSTEKTITNKEDHSIQEDLQQKELDYKVAEKEDVLINNILRAQFEKESGAKKVDGVIVDSSLKSTDLILALENRIGLPAQFKKLSGKKFELIIDSKEEKMNGK